MTACHDHPNAERRKCKTYRRRDGGSHVPKHVMPSLHFKGTRSARGTSKMSRPLPFSKEIFASTHIPGKGDHHTLGDTGSLKGDIRSDHELLQATECLEAGMYRHPWACKLILRLRCCRIRRRKRGCRVRRGGICGCRQASKGVVPQEMLRRYSLVAATRHARGRKTRTRQGAPDLS